MTSSSTYRRHWTYTVSTNGGPPVPGDGGVTVVTRLNSVNNGGPIPKWRQVISSGGNATSNASGSIWHINQEPAMLHHKYRDMAFPNTNKGSEVELEGNLLQLSFAPSGIPTLGLTEVSATNQALTRYYSNLASAEGKFKGLTFAGELKESLNMIRHPARALRNGISDYLSALKRGARNVAKRRRASWVRDTWLEYSFGWLPLISDLDSAIDSFYRSKSVRPIFEMVKGTGREETASYQARSSIDVGAFHTVSYIPRNWEEVYVKFFGIYRSDGSGVPNSHSYGFRPAEFIPTVWELIPYSFLVDYFTNVGNILSSWSYRHLAGSWTSKLVRRSYKHELVNVDYKYTGTVPTYVHSQSGNPGSASYEVVQFVRTRDAVLALPSLELQVPGRWTQWINILALSKQIDSTRRVLRN